MRFKSNCYCNLTLILTLTLIPSNQSSFNRKFPLPKTKANATRCAALQQIRIPCAWKEKTLIVKNRVEINFLVAAFSLFFSRGLATNETVVVFG